MYFCRRLLSEIQQPRGSVVTITLCIILYLRIFTLGSDSLWYQRSVTVLACFLSLMCFNLSATAQSQKLAITALPPAVHVCVRRFAPELRRSCN